MPMDVLLGKPPKMHRDVKRESAQFEPVDLTGVPLSEVAVDVLRAPDGREQALPDHDRRPHGRRPDRRDQMVGPWQVPVADCAVTTMDYAGFRGEAMTHGRAHAARRASTRRRRAAWRSARRSRTSLAAPIERSTKSSCRRNWMAACGEPGEDAALYDTVKAVGMELCPALGISIPVGKDSLSMRTQWQDATGAAKEVVVAGVADRLRVRAGRGRAPPAHAAAAQRHGDTVLIAIDLGRGKQSPGRQHPRAGDAAGRRHGARSRRRRRPQALLRRDPGAARRRQAARVPRPLATAACGRRSAKWRSRATWA